MSESSLYKIPALQCYISLTYLSGNKDEYVHLCLLIFEMETKVIQSTEQLNYIGI